MACSAFLSEVAVRAIPSLPAVILCFKPSQVLLRLAVTKMVLQKLVINALTSSKATNSAFSCTLWVRGFRDVSSF